MGKLSKLTPFDRGLHDFAVGARRTENPWPLITPEGEAWLQGWLHGKAMAEQAPTVPGGDQTYIVHEGEGPDQELDEEDRADIYLRVSAETGRLVLCGRDGRALGDQVNLRLEQDDDGVYAIVSFADVPIIP